MKHRHRRRQRATAALLAAIGIAACAVALVPDSQPARSTTSSRLATPILSARRAPGTVVDAIGAVRLADQLARIDGAYAA